MEDLHLSDKNRRIAENLFADALGRLAACGDLNRGYSREQDQRLLYGYAMLTKESLLRSAELVLKLVHLMQTNTTWPKGHDLRELWRKLPQTVKDSIDKKRETQGGPFSFEDFTKREFEKARYMWEIPDGQTTGYEPKKLYDDTEAVLSWANDQLGPIRIWPWAGNLDADLAGYRVTPLANGNYEVVIDSPINPLDWAGAVIEPLAAGSGSAISYRWTLLFGYTGDDGHKASYKLRCETLSLPLAEMFKGSVGECVAQIALAYNNPNHALAMALQEAAELKRRQSQ